MARGTLRIYLGAAPGVGKTFAMLGEGLRRRDRGTDVVVGLVETHGRALTAERIADLDLAVEGALFSGFGTAGQRCTSLGTVIVADSVHDEFLARFTKAV